MFVVETGEESARAKVGNRLGLSEGIRDAQCWIKLTSLVGSSLEQYDSVDVTGTHTAVYDLLV